VDRDTGDIGFYRRKSNDVVRVDSCPLLVPALDRLLREQERLRKAIPQGTEQIKAIAGSNGAVASCPVLAPLAEKRTVIMLGGKKFVLRGDGFFQGNALLTESLACWAKPWVQGEFFVDMYGGVGLFALSLAEKFARGMLIEESRSLVKQAQANFRQNAIAHVKAQAVSAEGYFRSNTRDRAPIDLLVVDPPRPGLTRQVREGIARMRPRQILYVSCNPATQARDVGYWVNRCDYTISRAALFDLYPQTHHLESALLLALG
jgi:tRNA/tmRNA/rRNA uracil-C5-methylase (TrmA/RlmC/RlmD family)